MEDEKKMFSTEGAQNDIKDSAPIDTLDALLFDSDDDYSSASDEEIEDFDAFMAEYRSLISKSLSEMSKETKIDIDEPEAKDEAQEKKEYEEEYLAPHPKKQSQKKKQKKTESVEQPAPEKKEWDEDITLEPEEYEDLLEEGKEMLDEIPEEFVPDFDLGESEDDNKFQLSMSFGNSSKADATPSDEEKTYRYDPDKPRAIDWVFDIAEMFVFVLAIVMILTTFVFKHSVVEGPSMNNTLADGDHLIISDLFYYPERGDIIVFEDYTTILKKAVVKRVIGLPGETVEIKVDGDGIVRVYINGELLPEEYAYNAKDCDISNYHAPITLGENEVFVMGDNRYHSTDSRHSGVGAIDIDSILGKVLFRFFPFDKFGAVD